MEIPITKLKSPETQEELDNFDDINPNVLKIIDKYQKKITEITNVISVTEYIGYFTFLIFLLMLTIKLSSNFEFNWMFLLLPAFICLISFSLLLNMYLNLKDIFDEAENIGNEEKNTSLGSLLSYLCLNTGCICVGLYLFLITLKMQGYVLLKLNEIAIPLYILSGIAMFYYIFIFPAFIKNKFYFDISVIGLYILGSFTFLVTINSKIDTVSKNPFVNLFLFFLIPIVFHMIYYLYLLITNPETILNNLSMLVSIILIFSGLLMFGLKLDNSITVENWVPMILIIISYFILISEKVFKIFEKSNPEN